MLAEPGLMEAKPVGGDHFADIFVPRFAQCLVRAAIIGKETETHPGNPPECRVPPLYSLD